MSDSSSVSSDSSSYVEEDAKGEAESDVDDASSEPAPQREKESNQSNAVDDSIEKLGDADTDSSESIVGNNKRKVERPTSVEANALFGDLSDEESDAGGSAKQRSGGESDTNNVEEEDGERQEDGEDGEGVDEGPEEPATIERLIQVEMPNVRFDLGKDLHYVRLPNFLSIDPRPFDPETYQGEGGDEEVLDEEGRSRLKMSVENTIRWQYMRETKEDGTEELRKRSNARIVRWSDGSLSLHLGSEIFDIHVTREHQDCNHMYVKQGNGLVGQAVFRKKLNFRPHSTDSLTHRKMTLSMADKTSRVQQVKEMPLGRLKNPELNKEKLIKQEEDALKATVRRETQQRRVRDRLSIRSLEYGMDKDDDEGGISLSSIKRKVLGTSRPRASRDDDDFIDDGEVSSGSDSESEEEEFYTSKKPSSAKSKKRRLLVADDDEDDDD